MPKMSVKNVEDLAEKQPARAAREKSRRYRFFLIVPLWLSFVIAILGRVWLTIHTNGVIDGDEALVAIQAQHILHGEHPIYFYGISYFGSLEAYLVALIFAVAGSSVWTLRAEPMLLSLIIVWLTWRLAGTLADRVRLSAYGRLCFRTVATLVSAVFPLYDTVLEMRTYGGYIEIFILMLMLLLSALRLTQRWDEDAHQGEIVLRWVGIGFIIGLGLWVDPLIVSAVFSAALWIVGCGIAVILRLRREQSLHLGQAAHSLGQSLLLALASIPAFFVGCSPALFWGATHNWQNITYILRLGNSMSAVPADLQVLYPTRLSLVTGIVKEYGLTIVPRIVGGAIPFEKAGLLSTIHTFTVAVGFFCLAFTLGLLLFSLVVHNPLLRTARHLALFPLLFAASTVLFFCISTASSPVLYTFGDFAGRYATPLMLALPFFFATTFTMLCLYISSYATRREQRSAVVQTSQVNTIAPGRVRLPVANFIQGGLFALLFIYLCAQIGTYELTDAGQTFQSSYCSQAPANNAAIIAYLQQEHVQYAWASNWIGFPIMFKTHQRIITADARLLLFHAGINRFPDYYTAVLHAARPAFLVFVRANDPHPQLLQVLDSLGVTYRAAFFPSQPGTNILVVTSLSRTVSLLDSKGFDAVFPLCS